jgi:hypothetical protein
MATASRSGVPIGPLVDGLLREDLKEIFAEAVVEQDRRPRSQERETLRGPTAMNRR